MLGSLSKARVIVPDIQAGCPTVIHAIDNVLLPDLAEEDEESGAAAGTKKKSMLGWADVLGLQG